MQCSSGLASAVERAGDTVEADLAGDHRRRRRSRPRRCCAGVAVELHRVVAEHELQVQLLADPEERRDACRAPCTRRRRRCGCCGGASPQCAVDDAGHADRLEHHERPSAARRGPTRRMPALRRGRPTSCAPMRDGERPPGAARSRWRRSVSTPCELERRRSRRARPGRSRAPARPSPGSMPERFTACRPTAIGSVSAAWRKSSPFGTSTSIGADSSIRSP